MRPLSRRRRKIADRLRPGISEDQREKYLNAWEHEGFDVSPWRQPEKVQPPLEPIKVDVIVPFWENDLRLIVSTLEALLCQKYVQPLIHVISDGCKWPELPDGPFVKYETPGGWGPYKIANAVFPGLKAEYVALNDGDDISYPDRLWKQVQRLKVSGAEITCCSMVNKLVGESNGCKDMTYWLGKSIPAKRVFDKHGPWGVLINGSRLMKRELFNKVNGFKNENCGMDFQFDNRIQRLGVPTFFDNEVLMDRRMHSDSLSLGGTFQIGTSGRERTNKIVENDAKVLASKNPCLTLVRSQGNLDTTKQLFPLSANRCYK